MRRTIAVTSFPGIDHPVTASFGVTVFTSADTEDDFIKRADTALYEAKTTGRNRVVVKISGEVPSEK
jgi:PleD family two-component response regulator